MKKERLIDFDKKQIKLLKDILECHIPNKTVWAYGSRVNWKAQEASDLDLAVFGCNSGEIGNLKEALDESSLLVSVDVMDWESIPEKFRENIKEKYVVVQRGLEGWREVKLSDVAEIKSGKRNSQDAIENGEYPLFDRSQSVKKSDKYLFDSKAIIVAGEGKEFIPRYYHGKFDLHQRAYAIFSFNNRIESKYIYYYLLSRREYFASVAVGSTVLSLRLNHFKNFPVLLPPLSEQKTIAEVLSSLDDKIDLLHRQNKTLEDMAQALFRKWFVEEADEGWEEKPLDKIANYLNGLACQKYPPSNETDKLPVLKIKELRNGIDGNSDWVTSEVKDEYIVNRGDIIFSWSGSLMIKLWDGMKCVLNQHLFKVGSMEYPKWYIYLWTKYHIDKFVQIAESKATTMGHIKRDDLSSAMVLVPTSEELSEMDNAVSPLLESVIHSFKQINTLKNFRDTLLPKLMSGTIKVII